MRAQKLPTQKRQPRRYLYAFAALGTLVLTSAALVFPTDVACTLVGYGSLAASPDRVVAEAGGTQQDRALFADLKRQARARIEEKFGPLESRPIIVFFGHAQTFWPLKLNSFGSAGAIRSCVLIGPNGRNVDVLAHELMHVELSERVGLWAATTQIPTWFNEGVAMQVDFRPQYAGPYGGKQRRDDLKSVRQFNHGSAEQVQAHYVFAKLEVGHWLASTGDAELYRRFARIRSGEAFAVVVGE